MLPYSAPGLLFPAISLLMLAFTNRFLGLASVARSLIAKHHDTPSAAVAAQIHSLRRRIRLTRTMQALGILSLALCVVCLYALFLELQLLGRALFSAALLLMLSSLVVSLREIYLSVHALEIEMASVLPTQE